MVLSAPLILPMEAYMVGPRHQGEVLQDGNSQRGGADAAPVVPPLRRLVIYRYTDVDQCIHIGGEKVYLQ